jgi:hypothetical protein
MYPRRTCNNHLKPKGQQTWEEVPWGSQALDDLQAERCFMSKLLNVLETQVRLVAEDKSPDRELLIEIAQISRASRTFATTRRRI